MESGVVGGSGVVNGLNDGLSSSSLAAAAVVVGLLVAAVDLLVDAVSRCLWLVGRIRVLFFNFPI